MHYTAGTRIGNYTLEERIGEPNMGDVWRAGRVALKTLPGTCSAGMRTRFAQECQMHQSLVHPHILPVLEQFEYQGQPFLVMPFAAGGSLEEVLRPGPLQPEQAVDIAIQILEALDHAHRSGIVHRDVKPSNILVHEGRYCLTDFGIAQSMVAATRPCDTSGTVAYMSPEQIHSPHAVDQRSDVYGLACVLYEMLTGQPPFQGDSDDQMKLMHISAPVLPPSKKRPGLDAGLERIVMRALHKQPAERYPGCGSFALALREWRRPVAARGWQKLTGLMARWF